MNDAQLNELAAAVGERLRASQRCVATVESCTGGGVACALTGIKGASGWFERGFVTYANDAKVEMVGVARELLDEHGAVSEAVAAAMAEGGVRYSEADFCVAVTGVAGPAGGSDDKPVGTVCFAWAGLDFDTVTERRHFDGDRHQVREQSVARALGGLLERLDGVG